MVYHWLVPEREMSIREVRQNLARVVEDAVVRGIVTHLTSHGRRVGAEIGPSEGVAIRRRRPPTLRRGVRTPVPLDLLDGRWDS